MNSTSMVHLYHQQRHIASVFPFVDSFLKLGRNRMNNKPLAIVVGGGYAGTSVAKTLDKHMNTILIDPKNYKFHNIAALRV